MDFRKLVASLTVTAALFTALPFTVFADEVTTEEDTESVYYEDTFGGDSETAEEVIVSSESDEEEYSVISEEGIDESSEDIFDADAVAEECDISESVDEDIIDESESLSDIDFEVTEADELQTLSVTDEVCEVTDEELFTGIDSPVAYVQKDGTTLTFFYDKGLHFGTGTIYIIPEYIEETADGIILPDWASDDDITLIRISRDFRNYKPIDIRGWFASFPNLTTIENFECLNTSDTIKMDFLFSDTRLTSTPHWNNMNLSSCESMVDMFLGTYGAGISSFDFNSWDTSNVKSMRCMFFDCSGLQNIDLSGLETDNLEDMSFMFYECYNLTGINFGNSFDAQCVKHMRGTFAYCTSLQTLNMNGVLTRDITDMTSLFEGCTSLQSIDMSGLNTSSVTSMDNMFYFCSDLVSVNLAGFSTQNVTDMTWMFRECSSLTSLDLSGFNTSKVISMSGMFSYASSLQTLNLSAFDTSKTLYFSDMFLGCSSLTVLDLSSFNTCSATQMICMFEYCEKLKTIYVTDNFTVGSSVDSGSMFYGADNLVGGNGKIYNSCEIDGTYAVIDSASRPGYFTRGFATTGIEGFVTRCYKVALGRNPDITGYNGWVNSLKNKSLCGSQTAYGFIFSPEYTRRNRSNTDYVTDLYNMFFGRTPSAGEASNWINVLNAGVQTREQVFAGFANSQVFYNLCNRYGVIAGYYICGIDYNKQGKINAFVARLYESCLGRLPDMAGQKNWVSNILLGGVSASTAVRSFLLSPELSNKHLSNEAFVTVAYQAFFGRTPDAAGLRNWVNALNNGMSREQMFSGFKDSPEFKNLCASYGITP